MNIIKKCGITLGIIGLIIIIDKIKLKNRSYPRCINKIDKLLKVKLTDEQKDHIARIIDKHIDQPEVTKLIKNKFDGAYFNGNILYITSLNNTLLGIEGI